MMAFLKDSEAAPNMRTPAEACGLVERLRDRAESYRMGGPSSEHTAAILDEAATALEAQAAELAAARIEADRYLRQMKVNAAARIDAEAALATKEDPHDASE